MKIFNTPDEFIDTLSSMHGRKFITFGYVCSANLNLPQGKRQNPKTGRMVTCDDMGEFGRQLGIETDIAGIVKLSKYNLRFMNREDFTKAYKAFQEKFADLKTRFDYPESTRKSDGKYTEVVGFGKGVEIYKGGNDSLQGKTYIRQDINGARVWSTYYIIDNDGNIVREYKKPELKQFIKTNLPLDPGVAAMRKLGRDEEKIQEYIAEFGKIKMMPKSFEYSQILYMVGKADGEHFIYINNDFPSTINHIECQINPQQFISMAKEQYADSIKQLDQYADQKPETVSEALHIFNHIANKKPTKAIYEGSRYNKKSKYNNMNLYESIMRNVAKEVKNALNEGAWGYKPSNSDDYLDSTHDICEPIMEYLMKRLQEGDSGSKYTAIGLFNQLLNANIWLEVSFDDDFKALVSEVQAACEDLKDSADEWSEPDEFLAELKNQTNEINKKVSNLKNNIKDY